VGDPSGKTEMRKLLTLEEVEQNAQGLKEQLSRFIDFSQGKALLLNNADWLVPLKYVEFLRDIGRHFSVNRMIKAESYRMRLDSEEGLSFIEFNYMVLQAYDFLALYDNYGCRLQMGGSDQWGNIVAGVDLIRRMRQGQTFGVTFPLITTSAGIKMGKTHQGAVWLDAGRTSSYDYYQFWINTEDPDVERFLALFTFLPMEEIRQVGQLAGSELNAAKAVLAFEATRLAHGEEEAVKAVQASAKIFGGRKVPKGLLPSSTIPRIEDEADDASVPTTALSEKDLGEGIPVFKLFTIAGLADSSGAARRLIQQGGGYMDGNRIESAEKLVNKNDFKDMQISLRAGKKRFHKIVLKS
jgi:tyrosyl-tRNA synthetase